MKTFLSALALVATMAAAPSANAVTCMGFPDGDYNYDNCGAETTSFVWGVTYITQCWMDIDVENDDLEGTRCRLKAVGWCDYTQMCTSGAQAGPTYSSGTDPNVVSLALFCPCATYIGKTAVIRVWYDTIPGQQPCTCTDTNSCTLAAIIQYVLCD